LSGRASDELDWQVLHLNLLSLVLESPAYHSESLFYLVFEFLLRLDSIQIAFLLDHLLSFSNLTIAALMFSQELKYFRRIVCFENFKCLRLLYSTLIHPKFFT
jgi:hypothetical protein